MEVAKEAVKPQKSDEAEVAHHFIEGMAAEVSGDGVRVASGRVDLQLLVNVALVHHRVKHVQHLDGREEKKCANVVSSTLCRFYQTSGLYYKKITIVIMALQIVASLLMVILMT
jgi:hypothetical protein